MNNATLPHANPSSNVNSLLSNAEKMVKRLKSRMLRDNLALEAMMTFALEDIPIWEEGS